MYMHMYYVELQFIALVYRTVHHSYILLYKSRLQNKENGTASQAKKPLGQGRSAFRFYM